MKVHAISMAGIAWATLFDCSGREVTSLDIHYQHERWFGNDDDVLKIFVFLYRSTRVQGVVKTLKTRFSIFPFF